MKLGHDLCLIERFEPLLLREALLKKIFSQTELEQSRLRGGLRSQFLAGSWAAKESLSKALGLGIFNWQLHEAEFVKIKPRAAREWVFSGEMAIKMAGMQAQTSVSYEAGMASAVTIVFKK